MTIFHWQQFNNDVASGFDTLPGLVKMPYA